MRSDIQVHLDLGEQRKLISITDNKIIYIGHTKEYTKDPEELVRAAVYVELVHTYEYSPTCISLEHTIPRRVPGESADIVIFTNSNKDDNYIVVETKPVSCNERDFNQAIDQGVGYANNLRAKYLVVDKWDQRTCFDVQNYPPNERYSNIIADIPHNYGKVPVYRIIRGSGNDLHKVGFDVLTAAFKKCHSILWSGGKNDPTTAFDEMSKLLFAKIKDETDTHNNDPYKFQIGTHENEVSVSNRVIELYTAAQLYDPTVFHKSIEATHQQIFQVVECLQDVSLRDSDIDSKGQAFETFLGTVFRGGLGQYFTRRQIVEFIVGMLEPNENDCIIDPSCGSGGFLLNSMKTVLSNIEHDFSGRNALISRKSYDFCHKNIYGVEINEKIARIAMMDMIVHDDGHTNIENNTGLNSSFVNSDIQYDKFTIVMTNPPFGVIINRTDIDNLGQNNFNNFHFGGSKKKQVSDVLFLEQYHKLLTSDTTRNPRAGIVLSNGVLNNPSYDPVIQWIKKNFKIDAVVSMPVYAFRKAGSGMKTCLIFLSKYSTAYDQLTDIPDYQVFFAIADHIGYDSTYREDTNDFPQIAQNYKSHTNNINQKCFFKSIRDLDYRLDPSYYYNMIQIDNYFDEIRSNGHTVVRLVELVSDITSGKSPSGGVTQSSGDVPSITVTNITKEGLFDFENSLNFVPDVFYDSFISSKGTLELYDIIIAKDGATTGKTAMINARFPFLEEIDGTHVIKAIFSEHVFRVRIKDNINPIFVNAYLNSYMGQLQLSTIISGGAQGGIVKSFADYIRIPLIDPVDQLAYANLWDERINTLIELKNSYAEHISTMRNELTDLIFSSHPASKEYINAVLGPQD